MQKKDHLPAGRQVVWFDEVDKDDVSLVGGKGANLGEMAQAGFPVPYGFIITSQAYFSYIDEEGFKQKIKDFLTAVNFNNPSELKQVSEHIRSLILSGDISPVLVKKIIEFYDDLLLKEQHHLKKSLNVASKGKQKLQAVYKQPLVAIRSSATAEDLPTASFAGQQETYLNIKGESTLVQKVKECWASLFTQRAIYYRHQQGFDHHKIGLAVVVQRMVQSDKSGVAFSIDPVTNDKNKIVIEAIWGLGEYIVGGKVTPDHYEVNKNSLVIENNEIHKQKVKLIKSDSKNIETSVNKKESMQQKISDESILELALLVKDLEKHYYFPQDIEWAQEKGQIFIVQTRPITTTQNKASKSDTFSTFSKKPFLIGAPASPGIGVGPAIIMRSPSEIEKIKKGDVLVASQTNPDYVPAMKKAVAIVTEKGGRTSHAAIVSRELGIPAVVGAENATKLIRDELIISVNGSTGEVFKGSILETQQVKAKTAPDNGSKNLKTLTKIYVNLAEPEEVKKIAAMNVDGVGLLRAEFMIAQIGVHPKEFIRKKKQHLFVNTLAKKLLTFVESFSPRPVIYRATDFKTNEYKNLVGGKKFETDEENPMLGFRGAARYITDPEVFNLELEAIKQIWGKGFQNLHLMIPFIRRPWELIKIKAFIRKKGLFDLPGFKLYIMVEVPSAALELEEFLRIGVDGISIGTNDLTMMVLGVDRDNQDVANLYDERAEAVVKLLEYIVETCQQNKIPCSVCGQAASDYPELVERLVRRGLTSVSVNPDAIVRTRNLIHDIEKHPSRKINIEHLT